MTKQIKNIFITGLSITFLLMFSCNEDLTNSETEADGLYNLKENHTWIYRWIELDEQGNEIFEMWRDTITVIGFSSYEIDGESVSVFELNYKSYPTNTNWFYFNLPDGLHSTCSINNFLHAGLLYKYPTHVGDTWQLYTQLCHPNFLQDPFNETWTFACTDTAAQFTTPLGSLNCYVYHFRTDNDQGDYHQIFDQYLYFKPGFGLVGTEMWLYEPFTDISNLKYKQILIETNVPF